MTNESASHLEPRLAALESQMTTVTSALTRIEANMRTPLVQIILVACAIATLTIGILAALGAAYSSPYAIRITLIDQMIEKGIVLFDKLDERMDGVERDIARLAILEERQKEHEADIHAIVQRVAANTEKIAAGAQNNEENQRLLGQLWFKEFGVELPIVSGSR